MKYEETARRLHIALENTSLIPAELSRKAGMSEASISQYLNGANRPSQASANKMAAILKCNPVWLMGYDAPMTRTYENVIKGEMEEILESLKRRKELQTLLDGSKNLSSEDINFLIEMINRMNNK